MKVLVLPGDGIGPEVVEQAKRVLEACAQRFRFTLHFTEAVVGGAAIDAFHTALPDGANIGLAGTVFLDFRKR